MPEVAVISGNSGAINNDCLSYLTVSNSTVSGNSTTAIYNLWMMWITNTTLSNNSGGAIINNGSAGGAMYIGSTVLKAGPSGPNMINGGGSTSYAITLAVTAAAVI